MTELYIEVLQIKIEAIEDMVSDHFLPCYAAISKSLLAHLNFYSKNKQMRHLLHIKYFGRHCIGHKNESAVSMGIRKISV